MVKPAVDSDRPPVFQHGQMDISPSEYVLDTTSGYDTNC